MFEILIFILILSFLVVIHELGHFFAAKWAKIKVEEFGLGYPPKALTVFTYQGTPFTLNWIPFGGFVKMEGEDLLVEEEAKKEAKKEASFSDKTAFQRLVVILAGVFVNFVFGIVAFAIVYSFIGIPTQIDQARIEAIAENSPAAAAGLPTNVNIIAIAEGEEVISVSSNKEAAEAVGSKLGKTITILTSGTCEALSCQESAQEFSVTLRSEDEIPEGEGALGVSFALQTFVSYPWYEQVARGVVVGVEQAVMFGYFIILSLGTLLSQMFQFGQIPTDVAGPVGIVHQAQEVKLFSQGPLMLLNFTGLLSVNLAIMNLLPIPALDGGRALFILLEKVIGKKYIQKIEGYANYGGFVFLLGLIILITARDIWRIFT